MTAASNSYRDILHENGINSGEEYETLTKFINALPAFGDIGARADDSKFQGDWSVLMKGLNSIMAAVYNPFKVIEITLNEMKAGNFDLASVDQTIANQGYDPNPSGYRGVFKEVIISTESCLNDIASYINELKMVLEKIANGDLCTEIRRDYIGSFDLIRTSVNNIISNLHNTITQISSASAQVLAGAQQISMSSTDLAEGATNQASSVQELSAMIEQIDNQSAENIMEMTDLIEKIHNSSIQQNDSIGQANEGLKQISAVVQTNSATSQESAAASQELNHQAETLQQMISQFKTND